METNILKYIAFVKTIEYGSFTRASEILNYSQSGISRMISDLEKQMNVCLLERIHTGVKLTSDGMRLLPYAKEICDSYNRLKFEVNALNGLDSGLIRIGTFSSVATHWLPNFIRNFQRDYPNIEYELLLGDYSEIEQWIIDGRVDFGFVRYPTQKSFDTLFLAQDKLLAILPKENRLATLDRIPIKELCKDPFMLLEKGTKSEVATLFERYKLTPDIRFTTWDDYSIMAMVERNLGVSILPELILKRVPYNIIIKELDVPAYREIGIGLKDKNSVSASVKKFLEYVKI